MEVLVPTEVKFNHERNETGRGWQMNSLPPLKAPTLMDCSDAGFMWLLQGHGATLKSAALFLGAMAGLVLHHFVFLFPPFLSPFLSPSTLLPWNGNISLPPQKVLLQALYSKESKLKQSLFLKS